MKASEAGKGHDRRPRLVADEVHGANHCRTFGHKWRGDWCMNCGAKSQDSPNKVEADNGNREPDE